MLRAERERSRDAPQVDFTPGRSIPSSRARCRASTACRDSSRTLLLAAGFQEQESVERFLHPRLRALSDPNLLPDMPAAVARLDAALRRRERIVLYGDYDVDGVASLALLHRVLAAYGGRVECFLPLRAEEGYGLSEAGLDRCIELHAPELLVAVDCGTCSTAEIAKLRARGIDVVVLDHHEPGPTRPDCVALVNRSSATISPTCAAWALPSKRRTPCSRPCRCRASTFAKMLDLVALATICDLVPLVGENRILVRAGLEQMTRSRWPGIAALLRVSSVMPPVRASDIGFRLGPRINAAGRLGTAQAALQLLLTNDPAEATRLAASLDAQNRERQAVERQVAIEVERWVEANFDATQHATIVAGSRDWHQGVLGIVARRIIMRRHHRPTLVVGFDETGHGKGSGRSIEGLSLVDALRRCEAHLGKFGGHEMAAGLNVHEEVFEVSARPSSPQHAAWLPTTCSSRASGSTRRSRSTVSARIYWRRSDCSSPSAMATAAGALRARRAPGRRAARAQGEASAPVLPGRRPLNAIYFNGAEQPLPRPPWDVAFHLERNEYNGRVEAQMHVVAIRSAA